MVCDENVVAGGHQTASVAYAGTIEGDGAKWTLEKELDGLEAAKIPEAVQAPK